MANMGIRITCEVHATLPSMHNVDQSEMDRRSQGSCGPHGIRVIAWNSLEVPR